MIWIVRQLLFLQGTLDAIKNRETKEDSYTEEVKSPAFDDDDDDDEETVEETVVAEVAAAVEEATPIKKKKKVVRRKKKLQHLNNCELCLK